ncbi:adenylate/guanylate cyclase domain-containing protein [Flavobacterium sp. ZS1P14]|uniref:adenylate/guanylate cyclase domain-containing protein n=1 Tax=Flavobacterium sp. ZS1P14 TaxID=3401729 RepID=UPI003AAA8BBC
MPNLNQIYELKNKYFNLSFEDKKVKDYIEKSEANNVIRKAFATENLNESYRETRMFSFLNESLNVKPDIIEYFDNSQEEDVALLFIDITSFSKTIQGFSNAQIKTYLDDYYDRIIPIIYDNGGEIEKLMGDGIIVVFGKPFLDLENPKYVYKAEECAEAVIKEFHGSNKNVKVAIHKGLINYYKVPGEHYGEYTIIGQPITDLYRLESVSKPNAINFYSSSSYDSLGWRFSIFEQDKVLCRDFDINPLQGVSYSQIRYIKFPGII